MGRRIAGCTGLVPWIALVMVVACGRGASGPAARALTASGAGFEPAPTRGYVVISLDTLRADHLSSYGYARDTAPFLTELAAGSTVFEWALAPYPATLVSHMSLFTGLYPREHGVYPPDGVLAEQIATLPEVFEAAGYRTAGFTEGGFVAGWYGFDRGFESFADPSYAADTDVAATLDRGLTFLASLAPREPFFLFLHSYAVHDPYAPPGEYATAFSPRDPGRGEASRGESLRAFNRGKLDLDPTAIDDFERLYDGTIRYVDSELERFWKAIVELGMSDDTTLVITSDHGEEFREHGRLGHTQLYPESLRVPLILRHPDQPEGQRVPAVVGLTDLAPTLYDLAGIDGPGELSGRSLVPFLRRPGLPSDRAVYAEVSDEERNRSLVMEDGGSIYQFQLVVLDDDPEGTWVSRRAVFDVDFDRLPFRSRSFHRPRTLRVSTDGGAAATFELTTDWSEHAVELGNRGPHRVTLEADDCDVPAEVGEGDDGRCLSFIFAGPRLARTELYDLVADPGATRDLSRELPALHRRLGRRLAELEFVPRATAPEASLSAEHEEMLRALGYLD